MTSPTLSPLDASATELATAIRNRTLSPTELLETHIERINTVNPLLNAVVATRFDQARREAEDAESLLKHTTNPDQLPPLLGVPCTIKEFFAVQGMPHTGGLWYRRNHRATHNAVLVERLRDAGAIILGVTNVPEGGMWLESDNPIFGRTNNPYDITRTSGGSSGGEGSIIAAGASPFGLGSDIAGSVRIPAAFCGIFAHKPTNCSLPSLGHFPEGQGHVATYMTGGPMTRSARDLQPLMDILSGPHPDDSIAHISLPKNPPPIDPSKLRVLVLPQHGHLSISPTLIQAQQRAAAALADAGAHVETIDLDLMKNSFWMWSASFAEHSQQPYGHVLGGPNNPINPLLELARYPFTNPRRHTLPGLLMALIDHISHTTPLPYASYALRALDTLRTTFEQLLLPNTVLLHPPYTQPAPKHNAPLLRPFDFMCTALFNILGYPVTQAPIQLSPEGLPCGVQIIAAPCLDHLTIQTARILEEHLGGWTRANPNTP